MSDALSPTDCDVLVVGLGPVGATLAALLADLGVSTIAIDKDTEVYPLPRAAHFDHEIMRLLQRLGIAADVLEHARPAPPYEFRSASGALLLRYDAPAKPGVSGWATSYMFHQPGLENALRAKLARSPTATVRLGRQFEDLVQHPDAVSVSTTGAEGPQTIRARYVVGCDGASSAVRSAIGSTLEDLQFDEPWLVIDAVVPADVALPDVNLQICDPARPTTCVLMGPGRHRWEFMLLPGETADEVLDDGFIRSLLAPWDGADHVTIERKAVYRFHGLVAQDWRRGRVLLAGDAAHQMPPFAGQGMCSGLRDAANLAWKIERVLRGRAGDDLLDSYQLEREPDVRALVALAIGMGRIVCTLDADLAARRDAQFLAMREGGSPAPLSFAAPQLGGGCIRLGSPAAGSLMPQPWWGRGRSRQGLDDTLGCGAWLIIGESAAPPIRGLDGVTVVCVDDRRLRGARADLVDWLDAQGAESVLVRPDRYVFGTGDPADLLSAYDRALQSAAFA